MGHSYVSAIMSWQGPQQSVIQLDRADCKNHLLHSRVPRVILVVGRIPAQHKGLHTLWLIECGIMGKKNMIYGNWRCVADNDDVDQLKLRQQPVSYSCDQCGGIPVPLTNCVNFKHPLVHTNNSWQIYKMLKCTLYSSDGNKILLKAAIHLITYIWFQFVFIFFLFWWHSTTRSQKVLKGHYYVQITTKFHDLPQMKHVVCSVVCDQPVKLWPAAAFWSLFAEFTVLSPWLIARESLIRCRTCMKIYGDVTWESDSSVRGDLCMYVWMCQTLQEILPPLDLLGDQLW